MHDSLRIFLLRARFLALGAVLFTVTAAVLAGGPYPRATAQAQSAPVIIRDTEIENWLRVWAEPVMWAAQLNPESVNFIIVQDDSLNAFVAGGQNVFIFTGLLLRSENPDEVIGVIAHELGHISGGHLVRLYGAADNAAYESILGMALGIGAAILTGNSEVAAAVASGTQSVAAMKFLSFNRVQESSADQAALGYLQRAEMDPRGLVSFMQKLEDQELLPAGRQSAYIRTHPLTRDRVETLQAGRERSPYKGKPLPAEWDEQHRRMKAKLVSFIMPQRVAWDYDGRDDSMAARYARTIAAYRQNHVEQALAGMDALIAAEPDNAFFHELKGQMLVDFGQVRAALPSYEKAIALHPDAALIRIAYAHALIESGGEARLRQAVTQLDRARQDEPRSSRLYRLLATAYGKMGDDAAAKVYLAEEALLKREMDYAKRQAEAALAQLPAGSKHRIRAQDIISYVEQHDKKE